MIPPKPYRQGVGAALFDKRGLVFVARRIGAEDAWQMPQGGIDPGESPRQAVLRELAEEIGTATAAIIGECEDWLRYDLPDDIAATVWGGRYRGQEQKWFALRFLGRDSDVDLTAGDAPEFDAWKWMPLDGLVDIIVPFKRPLYEAVARAFANHAVPAA